MTARGVGNMPGTIYRNLFTLKKKKSNKKKKLIDQNQGANQEEEKS